MEFKDDQLIALIDAAVALPISSSTLNNLRDYRQQIDTKVLEEDDRKYVHDLCTRLLRQHNASVDAAPAPNTLEALIRVNEARLLNEIARAKSLILEITDRIGEATLTYDAGGDVSMHPELARELDKPENVALRELLRRA